MSRSTANGSESVERKDRSRLVTRGLALRNPVHQGVLMSLKTVAAVLVLFVLAVLAYLIWGMTATTGY